MQRNGVIRKDRRHFWVVVPWGYTFGKFVELNPKSCALTVYTLYPSKK